MPIGARGHIGIKKELTWGVKENGNNDCFLPFISETLTANVEEVLSAAQRAVADEPLSYQGERSFAGDVVLEVHPASIGHILRSVINVPSSDALEGAVEVELEDCDENWVGNESIVSTTDPIDKKKGEAAIQLIVPEGVAAGTLLATKDFEAVDMTSDTQIKFWIKSSVGCDEGDLQLLLDETAECGDPDKTLDIDALLPGIWKEVTLDLGTMTDLDEIISIGLKFTVDIGECVINIDDVRRVTTPAESAAQEHIFIPRQYDEFSTDCPLNPYTLEVYRDQGNAFQFLGAIVNTLALSFGTGEKILKATCGVIAKNLGSVTKTEVGLETTDPFTWNQATIKIGDVGQEGIINNEIESFGINIDNACRGHYTCNRTVIPRKIIRDGYRTIPINFVTEFTDQTEYSYFIAGTERAFQVKFEGIEFETGYKYTLQIDLPKVKYTAYPINIGGPGRLTCAVTGKAKYVVNDGFAVKFTLINLETEY